jgi:hypothetical protein
MPPIQADGVPAPPLGDEVAPRTRGNRTISRFKGNRGSFRERVYYATSTYCDLRDRKHVERDPNEWFTLLPCSVPDAGRSVAEQGAPLTGRV